MKAKRSFRPKISIKRSGVNGRAYVWRFAANANGGVFFSKSPSEMPLQQAVQEYFRFLGNMKYMLESATGDFFTLPEQPKKKKQEAA